jgi:hypothetical protein
MFDGLIQNRHFSMRGNGWSSSRHTSGKIIIKTFNCKRFPDEYRLNSTSIFVAVFSRIDLNPNLLKYLCFRSSKSFSHIFEKRLYLDHQ